MITMQSNMITIESAILSNKVRLLEDERLLRSTAIAYGGGEEDKVLHSYDEHGNYETIDDGSNRTSYDRTYEKASDGTMIETYCEMVVFEGTEHSAVRESWKSYNDKNDLILEDQITDSRTDPDVGVINKYDHLYNDDGRIASTEHRSYATGYIDFSDENAEDNRMNPPADPTTLMSYRYDDRGNIIEEIIKLHVSEDDNTNIKITGEYDSDNRIVSTLTVHGYDRTFTQSRYLYPDGSGSEGYCDNYLVRAYAIKDNMNVEQVLLYKEELMEYEFEGGATVYRVMHSGKYPESFID